MNRHLLTAGAAIVLVSGTLYADLKNSLSGRLHQKDTTPAMVNLDLAKAKPVSRSVKAVVAVVWGEKLRKGTLDAYLKRRTKGKVSDFDKLDKKQRIALVKEFYLPHYIVQKAKKAVPEKEREALYATAWLQDAARKTDVPEERIERAYQRLSAQAKAKSALQQIPPYERIKERLKLQLAQRQIVAQLMRGATVREAVGEKGIAGYVGKDPITLEEAEAATKALSRGQKSWSDLSSKERRQLLHMIAPQKVIAQMARQNLTREQKNNLLANVWLQKESASVHISDDEVKKRYETVKKLAKKRKDGKKVPPYDKVAPMLKAQLAQEKLMQRLMKEIKVKLK